MQYGAALDRESIRQLITSPPAGLAPLVEGLTSLEEQLQPSGLDFSLLKVERFATAGSLGLDPGDRRLPQYRPLEFGADGWLHLEAGPYLVTFNEVVNIPLDLVALAVPRSSLLRSGVSLNLAIWDPGYSGRSQALLTIHNPAGYRLQQNARLMQLIFIRLARPVVRGYQGQYQGERP
jgi:dUTP pyrophosphatase